MHYVGIDVSHEYLDFALLSDEGHPIRTARIDNSRRAISHWIKELKRKDRVMLEQSLFCLEPTGHYSQLLLELLVKHQAPTWLAHPIHIKQSLGDQRGKSDELDALRIAQYAYRPGLANYYKRKVDEGKPKLLVLNAVRAKLIHRVFAVIKKGEPYNPNLLVMS